jgi:hypothetical protein
MSFSRPIQWFHSNADPIWPDGIFKTHLFLCASWYCICLNFVLDHLFLYYRKGVAGGRHPGSRSSTPRSRWTAAADSSFQRKRRRRRRGSGSHVTCPPPCWARTAPTARSARLPSATPTSSGIVSLVSFESLLYFQYGIGIW